jgi:hypothetical protein
LAFKNFSLDSRYTNLPEERIHRKYVWIGALADGRPTWLYRRL